MRISLAWRDARGACCLIKCLDGFEDGRLTGTGADHEDHPIELVGGHRMVDGVRGASDGYQEDAGHGSELHFAEFDPSTTIHYLDEGRRKALLWEEHHGLQILPWPMRNGYLAAR